MSALPGTPIHFFPFETANRVRDLLFYDGPLVSLFRTEREEPVLFVWVDVDEQINRWLAFRTSERDLIRYTSRRCTLRELVQRPADALIYALDINRAFKRVRQSVLPAVALPVEYLPGAESFLEEDESAPSNLYEMLIAGEWDGDQMHELLSRFRGVYLLHLHFGAETLSPRLRPEKNLPWKGGFSAVRFFDGLLAKTPRRERPRMKAFVYSSPGYVRWELEREVAEQVRQAVEAPEEDRELVDRLAYEALSYIRRCNLNHEDARPNQRQNEDLDEMFEALGATLWPDAYVRIRETHREPFVCLKVLLAYHKRIKFLRSLVDRSQLEL